MANWLPVYVIIHFELYALSTNVFSVIKESSNKHIQSLLCFEEHAIRPSAWQLIDMFLMKPIL